jgi:hypothetical protein
MTAAMTVYEQALAARAARWPEHACWRELTVEALREIGVREGNDFATALLHDRLMRSPEHGPFAERVASLEGAERAPAGALLAIVPGAGYREYPQTGADGRRLHEDARRHGWHVALAPVASFGAPIDNAQVLCDWLRRRPEETIVLVSLSKGSADVRVALARPDAREAVKKVAAWVSLSGIVFGTALVGWFLRRPWWRMLARLVCWRHGYAFSTLAALDRGPGGPLDGDLELPAGLRVVHVVGLPLACHLRSRRARRASRRLAALGPSDGGGILLGDLCRLPGIIYPVWGADHYLDPAWDLRPLVRRIVQAALEADEPAGAAACGLALAPGGTSR